MTTTLTKPQDSSGSTRFTAVEPVGRGLVTDTQNRLRDLRNSLANWSYTWGMKVNLQKCGVVRCRGSGPRARIGRRQRNPQHPVLIHMPMWAGETYRREKLLPEVTKQDPYKDLGLKLGPDLEVNVDRTRQLEAVTPHHARLAKGQVQRTRKRL